METRNYWEENGHAVKYENYNSNDGFGRPAAGELNFAAHSEDEIDYPTSAYLKKGKQDPMSHRIIEKRRRDRMNNCLADLSRLIPPEYLKKGRGRVEKTEIIEMAIRHLKYLQERANVAEKQIGEDLFKAGFQEAIGEAVRFLVEVQGYGPGDGLCVQLASHLQRHCERNAKGKTREPPLSQGGSSSETASSSSSSHGYSGNPKNSVITQMRHPDMEPTSYPTADQYEIDSSAEAAYSMECDRVTNEPENEMVTELEPLPLESHTKHEPSLRMIRKPEITEDYLHSYKFKNCIERRFSRSQDCEAADMSGRVQHPHGKTYVKRRRAAKQLPSTSTSNSGSTEEARDTSPQDTSSDSPHHHHYEKPLSHAQFVPVFALNAIGKYYVPLSVEYACLAKHLGPYDMLETHTAAPLHPVTIHVNFQPYLSCHLKRETATSRDWRP